MALADRVVNWLAPSTPDFPAAREWTPPALSAAATAPPQKQPLQQAKNTPVPQEWQVQAWKFYKSTGAARQAVEWMANGLSRMHLYIGELHPNDAGDPVPVDEPGLAGEILAELHDGQIGQRDMLYKLAVHLQVPGESWLIGYPSPDETAPPAAAKTDDEDQEQEQPEAPVETPPKPGEPVDGQKPAEPGTDDEQQKPAKKTAKAPEQRTAWAVCSRREWEVDSTNGAQEGGVRVKLPRHPNAATDGWVKFRSNEVVVVPVYQPDPEDGSRSTSRFEAILPDFEELNGLNRRVRAEIKSRLVGAGLMLIPESATLPNPGQSTGLNPLNGSPFVQALMQAASRAIENPDSPEAFIPIAAQVADESLAKLQHVDFATEFDSQVPVLREAARKAIASGADVPSSIVTGIEDLNHWSAWSVEADAVKSHLGPLASLICTTITREILWPALRAAGESDVESRAVWWDASEITLRPDRSTEALEAHKAKIISDQALRRELGFDESDAPDEAEMERRNPSPLVLDEDGKPVPPDDPAKGKGGKPDQAKPGQAKPGDRAEPPSQQNAEKRVTNGAKPKVPAKT